ncbi:HI1450 family dsDNA-mimic protein [Xenorhabdus khoisanae]|uniref:HI1450 family dsDNA-mimic protein n=1 Tax=Xenorhabdus khoisanae TaxID=880157 RepID=UPI002359DB1E|nr:HI1450 family dsDNA-mimic protein [Xenorhabdus khoisanae]MDC9614344.1 HI1450 family dsDNA-mimic protein [Xenorhabdus khoisanae]
MQLDINNRMTEDEALEKAYDIFLEEALSNLDPADSLLFNLQFEERGGAELLEPSDIWFEHVDFKLDPEFFSEVIIGLAESENAEIDDVFARILICREKSHPVYHILWKK